MIGIASSAIASEDGSSNDLSLRIGAEHTSGKYGTNQRTSIWTIPADLMYSTDNYLFDLSVPYVHMTGPAGAIAGQVRRRPRANRAMVTESGIGDSTASATRYLVDSDDTGWTWDVGGIVKFATGDVHRGLGTGANDYSLLTDLTKRFDRLALTGTLGRWWLGSPGVVTIGGVTENLQFKNVYYGYLGVSYRTSDTVKLGITLYREQATEKGDYPQRDLTLYANFDTSRSTTLRVYLMRGMDNGSPSRGIGLNFTVSM